jgi:hypothetical protein
VLYTLKPSDVGCTVVYFDFEACQQHSLMYVAQKGSFEGEKELQTSQRDGLYNSEPEAIE